jgi:hypothetical protein
MLDDFAAQADSRVTAPAIKSPVAEARKHSKAQSKADIFSMLDDFAAQAGTSDVTLPAKMENETKRIGKSAHTKAKSKADIFSMLDEFAAQAESPQSATQTQAKKKPAHTKAQSKADIFSMLDDFAAQAEAPPAIPAPETQEGNGSFLTKLSELDDFFEEEEKVSPIAPPAGVETFSIAPAFESKPNEEDRSPLEFFSKQVAPLPAAGAQPESQVPSTTAQKALAETQPKAAGNSIFGFFAKQAALPTTAILPREKQPEDDLKQTVPVETKPKFDVFANIVVTPEPARAPVRVERPVMKQPVGRTMSSATNVCENISTF